MSNDDNFFCNCGEMGATKCNSLVSPAGLTAMVAISEHALTQAFILAGQAIDALRHTLLHHGRLDTDVYAIVQPFLASVAAHSISSSWLTQLALPRARLFHAHHMAYWQQQMALELYALPTVLRPLEELKRVETQLADLMGTTPKQLKRLIDDVSACLMSSLSKSEIKVVPSSSPRLGLSNSVDASLNSVGSLAPAFTVGLATAIWSGVTLLVRGIVRTGGAASLHKLRTNLDLARLRMQFQMLCDHEHVSAAIAGLWGNIVSQCVSACLAQMKHRSTRLVALTLVALHTVLRWVLPSLMARRECRQNCLLAANQAWISAWTQLTSTTDATSGSGLAATDASAVRDPLLFLVDALLDCSREVLNFTADPCVGSFDAPGPLQDVSEVMQMMCGPDILRFLVRLAPADQVRALIHRLAAF
jgi:hypothetical protein